ncbi:MAG: NADH-quinone oxidoreductase subunit C [Verrucomicrobiales bacterium]|nr:NADH-quinone oxidoreductase subunit C [Verrucomicrobiales bacterium]
MSSTSSLQSKFGAAILETIEFRGETTLIVDQKAAKDILRFCKEELEFDYLVDISSLDNLGIEPRWEMVYELCQLGNGSNEHLRIKYALAETEKADTVSDLWETANWHEREVYDMMGIEFNDHPDLRRILMWEGFPYFPLRKDFPLAGRPSDMPDVAFSDRAPLEGGPFVTSPTQASTVHREPRSRDMD